MPDIIELLKTLNEHSHIVLRYNHIEAGYADKLILSLDNYMVLHAVWEHSIAISPSISTQKILERKQQIYYCARAFRQAATLLMQAMTDKFCIDLKTLDGLNELKHKEGTHQRGSLDKNWDYFLHGAECKFENKKTQQVVEVIVTTHPEFGFLDAYFFYAYMATTEQFKQLALWLDNYLHVAKAIDVLALAGVLTRDISLDNRRNIIAF